MLILDGIIFSLQSHGGISVYFRELISRLARDHAEATLLTYPPLRQEPVELHALSTEHRPSRPLERYRSCVLPRKRAHERVFHSTYYRQPSPKCPTVVTVHDFVYERFVHGPRQWVHLLQKHAAIRAADVIICVSNATRDDLLEFVGISQRQSVEVIHHAASQAFAPLSLEKPTRPYVLFVGQRQGYKNFALLLRAMSFLSDFDLYCIGGGPLRPEELGIVDETVQRRVRHFGTVSDAELNRLYNRATCLAYPSRYEGFGIPVLEAMQAGCPVVATRCKAVIEVGADALTISQDDPAAFANAILKVDNAEVRQRATAAGLQRAQQFDWETTYRKTTQIYSRLCAREPITAFATVGQSTESRLPARGLSPKPSCWGQHRALCRPDK